jgi:(p)ppGpp synthase/HD superfamily hydrolase
MTHPHITTSSLESVKVATDDVVGQILLAANFAAIKHRNQKRKDSDETPYINHPIGVAWNAYQAECRDVAVLQAAILHDTIEDTDTSVEELEKVFGKEVKDLVMECTDDKNLPKATRKQLQIDYAHKKSAKAKIVKMADKLYNLRDLQRSVPSWWTRERTQTYFVWAKAVTDGLKPTDCPILEQQLDDLYANGTFTFNGETIPCIPK